MPGEGQQVNPFRLHINWVGPAGLRCIHQQQQIMRPGDLAHLGHRQQRADHVGSMVHHDQDGFGADRRADVVRVQQTSRRARHHGQGHALAFQRAQGPHDGVMLHAGCDDVIARPQHPPQGQVKCFGDVGAENHPERIGGIEQGRDRLPRPIHHPAGIHRQAMPGAAGIGPDFRHEMGHRRSDSWRFGPGSRCVIKVN